MVLLDEEAGTWYCYKDDVLFYATENKWVGSEKPNSGLVKKTPEIGLPYHPEPSGAEFLRPSDANPESSIDRQDTPREEGVTGFLWRIALAIGFFILLLIVFYLLMASCFYPTPGGCGP